MRFVVDKMPDRPESCPLSKEILVFCFSEDPNGVSHTERICKSSGEECPIGVNGTKACPFLVERFATPTQNSGWRELFFDLLTPLCSLTHGKQMYFDQEDGTVYSRISCKYMTPDEAITEYLNDVKPVLGE